MASQGGVVLVAGATGAVGRCVVEELALNDSINRVYVLVRRSGSIPETNKIREIVLTGDYEVDFRGLPDGIEAVFSCIGTNY